MLPRLISNLQRNDMQLNQYMRIYDSPLRDRWDALHDKPDNVQHVPQADSIHTIPIHFPLRPRAPSRTLPSLHPRHPPLHPEPSIRRPALLDLLLRQPFRHLLHLDQLLDLHDHTTDLGRHGVEDNAAATGQPQGLEDAACPFGQTDGGAVEGYAEEGHGGDGGRMAAARSRCRSVKRLVLQSVTTYLSERCNRKQVDFEDLPALAPK